jgi:hypothetical protein
VDTKAKAKGSSIPDVADATEALRLLWAVVRAFQALSASEQSLPVPQEKYHSFLSKLLPQIYEVFIAGTPSISCDQLRASTTDTTHTQTHTQQWARGFRR